MLINMGIVPVYTFHISGLLDLQLVDVNVLALDSLLIAYDELFNYDKDKDIYLFLDEIQNIKNWEKWVKRIYDFKKYKIIISGSSSKLLSREISTALAGRNINYTVYPLSFKEFLKIKKIKTHFK